jgi:addiction module HigA family antidote
MLPKNRPPTRPGEILYEIITEMHITQAQLAKKLGVSLQTVNLIINGKRSITPDTAIGLAKTFDMSPQFWMNAQTSVDLWEAQQQKRAHG